MMPKKCAQKLFSSILILTSSVLLPLHSVETDGALGLVATTATATVPQKQPRAQISRPLSKKEKHNIDKMRAKSIQDAMKAAKKLGMNPQKHAKTLKPKACFSYTNPNFKLASLHKIKSRSPRGELIEIENGASFTVRESDYFVSQSWQANSPLRIYSKAWGSKFDYQLYNELTGQTVQANLSSGPYLYDSANPNMLNPKNRYLAGFNPTTGDTALYGGDQYRVSSSYQDLTQLAKWQKDDIIIIGDNDTSVDWFGCQFILINIATNSYVTADRLY